MADYHGSNTPIMNRNQWQTPLWLFDALDHHFGFSLDAAATANNAKCSLFFTEQTDALKQDWFGALASACVAPVVWVNPPYGRGCILPFVRKAAEEAAKGCTVVMLIPQTPDTGWWADDDKHRAAHISLITKGRIHFIDPITGEEDPNNPKGSSLLIFQGTPTHTTYGALSRSALLDGELDDARAMQIATGQVPAVRDNTPIRDVA